VRVEWLRLALNNLDGLAEYIARDNPGAAALLTMADAIPNLDTGTARSSRRRTGSVILLVLMTLLLTAFALTKYLEKASIDLMADARDASADRLRVHAYSALETVLAVLQEFQTANSGLHSPAEGWGAPLDFAGYTPPDGLTVEATLEG